MLRLGQPNIMKDKVHLLNQLNYLCLSNVSESLTFYTNHLPMKVKPDKQAFESLNYLWHTQRVVSTARIMGGGEAIPNSIPYQVAMVLSNTSNSRCGGAILSEKFVITAAHCFDLDRLGRPRTRASYQIMAGEHDLGNDIDKATRHNIKKITIHPNWQ